MRKLIVILLVVLSLCTVCLPAYAAETDTPEASATESVIEPRADVIVMKYRVYNGVYQCRRWNETQGYWVDPYWVNIND